MVKFCLASDVHLEHGATISIPNTEGADCLLLTGDIVEARLLRNPANTRTNIVEFFKNVSRDFARVLWIPGNHDYWRAWSMEYARQKINKWLEFHGFSNVQLCSKVTVDVCGVPVHCATLWTDYNRHDSLVMFDAGRRMNDHQFIRGDTTLRAGSKVTPQHLYQLHCADKLFLSNALSDGVRCVVATHHHPLMQTLNSRNYGNLDYAYGSEMSDFILDHPHVVVWCCGHTHNTVEFPIGDQLVLVNCHGYSAWEPTLVQQFAPKFFNV